jgi:short-chain fatty acids transporter
MTLLPRASQALGHLTARWVPSAFSLALLLTAVTFVLAVTWGNATVPAALSGFRTGLWDLLAFSMQMALVMFLGYLLALTEPVSRLLTFVARFATSPKRAVALMAVCSMGLAIVNWGLSLVASAVLARRIAERCPQVDYRLLVACAYLGLGATFHAGFSASVPLTVATPGHFLERQIGLLPLNDTLFSWLNLSLLGTTLIALTLLALAMHPKESDAVRLNLTALSPDAPSDTRSISATLTLAERTDGARGLSLTFGVGLLLVWVLGFVESGWTAVNLNTVNLLFLGLACALHRSPLAIGKAAEEAVSSLSGIVLQFPLYAGIYGLFKAGGLTEKFGEIFVSVSNRHTFPTVVYLYTCVVDYLVPSGGAKWVIEGPYLMNAAQTLGVSPALVITAYSWGDMTPNLIQPFWALPLLGIAKLQFKDVLGFLLVFFGVHMTLSVVAFTIAGFWS